MRWIILCCALLSAIITPGVSAKQCAEADTKIIGRITVEQSPFQSFKALRKVPFVTWDALKSGFSRLIFDTSLCMTQQSVIYSHPEIGNELPLKPVRNLNLSTAKLVTDFYHRYDEEAEVFLTELLSQQKKAMSIVVYWDTPTDAELKAAIEAKKVVLSYTIFDSQNYTEIPFDVEIDLPIVSKKRTIEKLATQFYEQIKEIRENISAGQTE